MAQKCTNPTRKQELLVIANNCANVPENPARNFYEACQTFWFIQMLLQIESSGHSISAGRFDQYLYPYYRTALTTVRLHANLHRKYLTVFGLSLTTLIKQGMRHRHTALPDTACSKI